MNFLITCPAVALMLPLVLAITARWILAPADRKRTEWLLVAVTLVVPLGAAAEAAANFLSHIRPLKYDLYVYRIDQLFGEPSFALGSLAYHHSVLRALVGITYGILPLVIAGVFALYLYSGRDALHVAKVFVLNFVAIVPLYLLFPVCGPGYAFPAFPALPGPLFAHPILLHAAPNGVPSGHTSSALLILALLWPWKWARLFGFLFLGLTVFATLGSGQHYFFDLLCAVPYAAGVLYLTRSTLTQKASTEGRINTTASAAWNSVQLTRLAAFG